MAIDEGFFQRLDNSQESVLFIAHWFNKARPRQKGYAYRKPGQWYAASGEEAAEREDEGDLWIDLPRCEYYPYYGDQRVEVKERNIDFVNKWPFRDVILCRKVSFDKIPPDKMPLCYIFLNAEWTHIAVVFRWFFHLREAVLGTVNAKDPTPEWRYHVPTSCLRFWALEKGSWADACSFWKEKDSWNLRGRIGVICPNPK